MAHLKRFKQCLSIFFLLAFVIVVQGLWGWEKIFQPWQMISGVQLLLGMILLFVGYAIRALRLYHYFYPQVDWWVSLRLMLFHNFLNNFLPARTGEVSFPILMKRYFQIDYDRSIAALLWFRILDLHILLSIGMLVGLLYYQAGWLWLVFGIWFMLPLFMHIAQKWLIYEVIKKQNSISVLSSDIITEVLKWTRLLLEGLPDNYTQLARSWLLSLVNWVIKLLVLAWFMSLFIEMDLLYLMASVVAGELTSVLPVHAPGGFGTYEAGVLLVLAPLTNNHQMLAQAAINMHLMLLGSSVLGAGMAMLLPNKIVSSDRKTA